MKPDNQKQNSHLLIVGAFAPEVDLLADIPVSSDANVAGFDVFAAGIGSVAAAVSVQERILNPKLPPVGEVLFLGSAGAYDSSVAAGPGRFAFSTEFCKRDLAAIEGRARLPGPTGETIQCEAGRRVAGMLQFIEAKKFAVGVTNSTDSVSLVNVAVKDCNFENLETYGIAWVCKRYNLPFAAMLALTNTVGPAGSEEWSTNHREMSLELQGFLSNFLI